MNLFIDCEWNSFGGQLLSIALVSEDLDVYDFYREFLIEEKLNPWVKENVVPYLYTEPYVKGSVPEIQSQLAMHLEPFNSVHIVADWPEDIERFCKLLITGPGTRIDTPPLSFEIVRCNPVSKVPHYALADAQALRAWYLENVKGSS